MRVRNKEHQSLGLRELEQLCIDNANDSSLGLAIRKIVKDARINGYMTAEGYADWRKDTIWEKKNEG